MSVPSTEEVQGRIREHLQKELQGRELDPTTPLLTGGLLNSIGALNLVTLLEREFGVQIDTGEISVETFDTIEAIAALVASKLGPGD